MIKPNAWQVLSVPFLSEEAEAYQSMSDVAYAEAKKDVRRYPLEKNETKRDRYEKHLLGMLEMYCERHRGIGNTRSRLLALKELKKWKDSHPKKAFDAYLEQTIADLEHDLEDLEGKEEELVA